MTTAEHPDGASWREWSEWWAHSEPWCWVAMFVLGTALRVAGAAPGWVVNWSSVVIALVLTVNAVLHEVKLCSRCLSRMPTDPQRAARRSRWALWLNHKRWWMFGLAIGLCLTISHVPLMVEGLLTIGVFLMIILVSVIELRHHKLQLWCPYCPRWRDGGGDGVSTPVGPPHPSGVKQHR